MPIDPRFGRHPARVLLVVDQPRLVAAIKVAIGRDPYTTRIVHPEDADGVLREWRPHLAVVDLDIPNEGFSDPLATSASTASLAIVALTRRADIETRLAAFARGVDDVLTIPFVLQEFAARVRAVVRRADRAFSTGVPVLRLGGLEIDLLTRSVRVGERELRLTALEKSLLCLLALNAGRVVTRDEILDHLWGVDFAAGSNVVDRQVRALRAKLGDDWQRPRYIATVPGLGYRFLPAPLEPAAPLVSSGRRTG